MKNNTHENDALLPGIDTLFTHHLDLLRNRRVGLIAHPASVDSKGVPTAERLWQHPDTTLAALLGPEHGYSGTAAAGIQVENGRHTLWDIPVHSLYGDTRKPTAAMLNDIDTLIFDLQDIPVRCYTYSSTLRYAMQAAAEQHGRFIVTDRPAPLFRIIDGPALDPDCESFVGMVDTPTCYGLTSGETALLIQTEELPHLDLHIVPLQHDHQTAHPLQDAFLSWIPPSPSLKTLMNVLVYPITVCCEALPALDYGKGSANAFRVIGAPWIDKNKTAQAINNMLLPGLRADPVSYRTEQEPYVAQTLNGVLLTVTDPTRLQPVSSMYAILLHLQQEYGLDTLWKAPGTRPAFFDKLIGNHTLRENLLAGLPREQAAFGWKQDLQKFKKRSASCLLYH
jgi:uncharacterized protein YbbC (DUF1343 family)